MKKNEYVAPEMEIVKITEQCGILAASTGNDVSGELNPDNEWGGGYDDED